MNPIASSSTILRIPTPRPSTPTPRSQSCRARRPRGRTTHTQTCSRWRRNSRKYAPPFWGGTNTCKKRTRSHRRICSYRAKILLVCIITNLPPLRTSIPPGPISIRDRTVPLLASPYVAIPPMSPSCTSTCRRCADPTSHRIPTSFRARGKNV